MQSTLPGTVAASLFFGESIVEKIGQFLSIDGTVMAEIVLLAEGPNAESFYVPNNELFIKTPRGRITLADSAEQDAWNKQQKDAAAALERQRQAKEDPPAAPDYRRDQNKPNGE